MSYNPLIQHRRSIRRKGYDYTQPGAYFITIGTHRRQRNFGEINGGNVQLNSSGKIVSDFWYAIPTHFPNVDLDAFIVMPDHVHGILILNDVPCNRRGAVPAPAVTAPVALISTIPAPGVTAPGILEPNDSGAETAPLHPSSDSVVEIAFQQYRKPSLGQVVAYFKYGSAKQINAMMGSPGASVWQRNYYEHIIRNEEDLSEIQQYIKNNPVRWQLDKDIQGD